MDLENAITAVEKKYNFVLGKSISYSFIEKISEWIGKVTNEYKNENPDWFRKILSNVANEMEICKAHRRKVYMSLAGQYFGKRGGNKAASNRKKKETQRIKNTKPVQKVFSLENNFTRTEITL